MFIAMRDFLSLPQNPEGDTAVPEMK